MPRRAKATLTAYRFAVNQGWFSGRFGAVAEGGATPASAQQIEVRADLGERIARRVNAVHSWQRIENDLAAFWLLIVHPRGQGDGAERNINAIGRPVRAGVGHGIAGLGDLDEEAELDRLFGQAGSEFIK